MKHTPAILIVSLCLTILIWLAAPFIAYYPSWVYSFWSECKKANPSLTIPSKSSNSEDDRCDSFMAKQGQSGDIFGATTSIFSGLALFAVAFTLYADLAHRRRERKPLIVCNINNNDLNFDKPVTDAEPKMFYLRGTISASSIAEIAMNVIVFPSFVVNEKSFPLSILHINVPMEGGKDFNIQLSDVIDRCAIDALCREKSQLAPMYLHFKTNYSNLDGENFASEVTYKISLTFPDNLNKIVSMRHSGYGVDGSWDDRGAIPLTCKLEPSSWKFSSGNK